MTEVQVNWHPSTTFIEVVCFLGDVIPDGTDADAYPDLYTNSGQITLSLDTPGGLLIVRDAEGHERLAEFQRVPFVIQAGTGTLVDAQGRAGLFVPQGGVEPEDRTMSGEIVWKSGRRTKVGPFRLQPNQADGRLNIVRTVSVDQAQVASSLAARVAALEAVGPGQGEISAARIVDATATGRAVLTASDAVAARSAIGAGTSSLALGETATTAARGDDPRLSDARIPRPHSHTVADVTDLVEAMQDVVGAMIAAAGGSYDDEAGTITLSSGGEVTTVPLSALTPGSRITALWTGAAWEYPAGEALTDRPALPAGCYIDLVGAPAATPDPSWLVTGDGRLDV